MNLTPAPEGRDSACHVRLIDSSRSEGGRSGAGRHRVTGGRNACRSHTDDHAARGTSSTRAAASNASTHIIIRTSWPPLGLHDAHASASSSPVAGADEW